MILKRPYSVRVALLINQSVQAKAIFACVSMISISLQKYDCSYFIGFVFLRFIFLKNGLARVHLLLSVPF